VTVSDDDDDAPDLSLEVFESRLEDSAELAGDGEVFASDELDVDGTDPDASSAHAAPGTDATAAPTPSATANAPTRPMCLAWPGVTASARDAHMFPPSLVRVLDPEEDLLSNSGIKFPATGVICGARYVDVFVRNNYTDSWQADRPVADRDIWAVIAC
jgi:hypothetical protein